MSCRSVPAGQEQETAASRYEYTEVHMGTRVRLVLHASGRLVADSAAREAYDRVARLEDIFSDYRPQSELSRIGRGAGEWVVVSSEMLHVIGLALRVADVTAGSFDPTIKPLVTLWREARDSGVMPPVERVDSARALAGWRKVRLDTARNAVLLPLAGMQLDLGGIAKGYILGEALEVLRERGVSSALVEAGGDLVVGDAPPGSRGWRVEVPGATQQFTSRSALLLNEAMATSGSSAQFVEIEGVRRSHVLDPRTGLGVTHELTAHVIHADAALADALATALSVMGKEGVEIVRRRFPGVVIEISG